VRDTEGTEKKRSGAERGEKKERMRDEAKKGEDEERN